MRLNKLKFTDLELLKKIHSMYSDQYLNRGDQKERFYIPIDCDEIAKRMGVDAELVFQRLYSHLEKKFGYTNEDNSKIHLFAFVIGDKKHCINYPYLCAILANMEDEKKELRITQIIAISAIVISLLGLFIRPNTAFDYLKNTYSTLAVTSEQTSEEIK